MKIRISRDLKWYDVSLEQIHHDYIVLKHKDGKEEFISNEHIIEVKDDLRTDLVLIDHYQKVKHYSQSRLETINRIPKSEFDDYHTNSYNKLSENTKCVGCGFNYQISSETEREDSYDENMSYINTRYKVKSKYKCEREGCKYDLSTNKITDFTKGNLLTPKRYLFVESNNYKKAFGNFVLKVKDIINEIDNISFYHQTQEIVLNNKKYIYVEYSEYEMKIEVTYNNGRKRILPFYEIKECSNKHNFYKTKPLLEQLEKDMKDGKQTLKEFLKEKKLIN